jgi:hypothetical protein
MILRLDAGIPFASLMRDFLTASSLTLVPMLPRPQPSFHNHFPEDKSRIDAILDNP